MKQIASYDVWTHFSLKGRKWKENNKMKLLDSNIVMAIKSNNIMVII